MQAGAQAGWWEAADGAAILLATTEGLAAPPEAQRFDALADGRCFVRLALLHPRQPAAPGLAALLCAAGALLRARAQADASGLEAERLLEAGRVASDWLWETNAEGAVMWMTESIAVLTGYTASSEVGTRTLDRNRVRTDEYAASYERYLADRAARRPIRDFVVDRQTTNGLITVSISGEPRFGPDGTFLGYRGATRNITAELAAKAEARRAQDLLQQALEGMPAGVMISGPDDRILMSNARWRNGFGRGLPRGCDTWSAVIRHHALAGHYPDAIGREEEYVAWRLALASETPLPVEMRWRNEWVLSADRLLSDGSTVHLSIYVTERKLAERALAHAEDRWRFALDGAGHGVWDWERDGATYFSPSWKSMLGHAEDEVGSSWREWFDRVHPDDRADARAAMRRYQSGESSLYETEYRLRHRDGRYLWVHDRGRAIKHASDGRVLRMVGTQSDITRLREADQAMRDKQAAELVSQSTSEFLSRMSHEIRTPLNAVIGFADLLHVHGEYRADHVEHILAAGRHLLELINDVLDLQQVEQGDLALRTGGVDLAALARDVVAMLRPQADKLGLALQLGDFGDMHVQADEQRLRQVLLNLGSNAIKYNRPGGQVQWRLDRSDPQRWGIVTGDTGPGLDADQLKCLFRPFERLGRETSATEGSGLGLVIARRLVQAMGGELLMESRPGQGTQVTVWLPRAQPADTPATSWPGASAAPEPTQVAARRVMYVEDNPLNALLFEEALRRHLEIALRVAPDGDEALQIASAWRPDLLVIDMHLPGANGIEVLRRLRALPGLETVPAVMCSADAMPQDLDRTLAAGFVSYWTKPLDVRLLAQEIHAVLDRN